MRIARMFSRLRRSRPLSEWFFVSFDDHRVTLKAEPPGREAWTQEFTWGSVVRVGFKAEDLGVSDGIYVFTSDRPESYSIPTEAAGGSELWLEILRRGLFDATLAIEAMAATSGSFFWPAIDKPA